MRDILIIVNIFNSNSALYLYTLCKDVQPRFYDKDHLDLTEILTFIPADYVDITGVTSLSVNSTLRTYITLHAISAYAPQNRSVDYSHVAFNWYKIPNVLTRIAGGDWFNLEHTRIFLYDRFCFLTEFEENPDSFYAAPRQLTFAVIVRFNTWVDSYVYTVLILHNLDSLVSSSIKSNIIPFHIIWSFQHDIFSNASSIHMGHIISISNISPYRQYHKCTYT